MLGNPPPAALERPDIEVPFAGRMVTAERSTFDVVVIDEAPWIGMIKVRSARVDLSDLNRSYIDEALVGFRGDGERAQVTSASIKEPSNAFPRLRAL
jgi:hypothetical protein